MSVITRTILVSGNVQGVGFRQATRNQARNLGIKGKVKNLRDGRVYIEAQGEEKRVMEFIRWCHSGPTYARVNNVEVEESEEKKFLGFEIVY